MNKQKYLLDLIKLKQTIFTTKDISLLWNSSDNAFIKEKLYRYTKANKLFRIRKGIYSKDKNFESNELATKIFTPAYISFETVLAKEGLIFQYYSQIFSASYQTKKITILNQEYVYRKIKNEILVNMAGIENKNSYSIATKERAFLDMIYINKNFYFDNLSILNWDKVFDLLPIYKNKSMQKTVNKYYKENKND